MNNFDIAIVGGGISGLVAAYLAAKDGKSVVVLEQNPSLGGCVKSKDLSGFILETGANTIALNEATRLLIEELNLSDRIMYPSISKYKQYIWDTTSSKPIALPKSPFQLLTCKLFTTYEKLQIIYGLFKKVEPKPLDSIDQVFSSLIGTGAVQKAISPALRGIFGGDSSKLLAEKTFPRIYEALADGKSLFSVFSRKGPKRKIFTLKGGNSKIIELLCERIGSANIKNHKVTSIEKIPEGFHILTNDEKKLIASKLIIATSGSSSSSIINKISPSLAQELQKMTYSPIVAVHFCLDSEITQLQNGFGVLFPFSSGSKIIGVLCNSTLFPQNAPNNKSLITVCLGGVGQEALVNLSEDQILLIARSELLKFFNVSDAEHLNTTYWPKAIPQFTTDTCGLESLFAEAESTLPGLFFVGVDRGKIGVPDRIEYVTNRMNELL